MRYCLRVEQDFLLFPILPHSKEREVLIFLNGNKIYHFHAALWTKAAQTEEILYGELPVKTLRGETIEIEIRPLDDTETVSLRQSDSLQQRKEEYYPYLHFTPKLGHMNDPNGLCFYKGEYHLFFQHNLFDIKWNNIGWGHAVSHDLLHWRQVEEALMPDEDGEAYSGCAVENTDGRMPDCPAGALLLFYTCAGGKMGWSDEASFTQKVAWSLDGRTFTKLDRPVIPHIVGENRDPKVDWNEESGSYYMALFLDGHEYGVFRSGNMREWELTQRLTIEESWECPDLVRVPVRGQEQKKWMFWTPDGYYLVGEFDGRQFLAVQETKKIYGNIREERKSYAAQTFWGLPDRAVQIPWLTVGESAGRYSGMMGLPRELELIRKEEGYVLAAHLVREFYDGETRLWDKEITGESRFTWTEKGVVMLQVRNRENDSFVIEFAGATVAWEKESGTLKIGGLSPASHDKMEDMVLTADKGILEIGCNGDTICYFTELEEDFPREVVIKGRLQALVGVVL